MICKTCGEQMEGDGFKRVLHCPASDTELTDYSEPDADPIHCEPDHNTHEENK